MRYIKYNCPDEASYNVIGLTTSTLTFNAVTSTFSSGVGSRGDNVVIIEADTDNTVEDSNPILKLQQDGGGAFGHFGLNGNPNNTFTGATVNSTYVRASTDLQFVAGSTVLAATILSNGRVGIGTNTPTEVFEVGGSSAYIAITNTAETDSGIIFKDIQDATNQAAAIKFGSGDNKLKFFVNDDVAQRMVIDTSGNVGINTTNPDVKFHVTENEDGSGLDKGTAKFINTILVKVQLQCTWCRLLVQILLTRLSFGKDQLQLLLGLLD